jgi:hypothetical protein
MWKYKRQKYGIPPSRKRLGFQKYVDANFQEDLVEAGDISKTH